MNIVLNIAIVFTIQCLRCVFVIVFLDLNRSVEQKVACVLIQRMTKCYPTKSVATFVGLRFINIFVGLSTVKLWKPKVYVIR